MEIFAFILCFVVLGFLIITTDFKQNKVKNIIFVMLCSAIISTVGIAAFYMEPVPKSEPTTSSHYIAPTENPLEEINEKLDKIEKKLP
jgi:hypothetical protein